MRTEFRLLESMTTPSATCLCPKNECPWPRIATLTPRRFANCTSFAMSSASLGRSMKTDLMHDVSKVVGCRLQHGFIEG
jgi:hypothetical protein